MLQGPQALDTVQLVPVRLAAPKRSTSPGVSNTRSRRVPAGSAAASLGPLAASCAVSTEMLRESVRHEPLLGASRHAMLSLERDASVRQLQTLDLLLCAEAQRLASMDEAARVAMEANRLVAVLQEHKDVVEESLYRELLESLEAGNTTDDTSSATGAVSHSEANVSPRRRKYSGGRRWYVFARFLARYPKSLLRGNPVLLDDVITFADKMSETLSQVELLEMLQLHESQRLASLDHQLQSRVALHAAESPTRFSLASTAAQDAGGVDGQRRRSAFGSATSSSVGGTPRDGVDAAAPCIAVTGTVASLFSATNRTATGGDGDGNADDHRVVVLATSRRGDAALTTAVAENASPLSQQQPRPLWSQYFVHSDIADTLVEISDERRCCLLIEDLLRRLSVSAAAMDERERVIQAMKQREASTAAEHEVLRQRIEQLEGQLVAITNGNRELEVLLGDVAQRGSSVEARLHDTERRKLDADESWARYATRLMEESGFVRLQALQFQAFLVYVTRERHELEMDLEEEHGNSVRLQQELDGLEAERRRLEDAAQELREEVASLGADRALLRAKVDMYQQTVRVDEERHRKLVDSQAAEIAAMRDRMAHLEAQLDVWKSTSVPRHTAAKAASMQSGWDATTTVKQLASSGGSARVVSCSPPPRVHGSTQPVVHTAVEPPSALADVSPRPRQTLPPQPST